MTQDPTLCGETVRLIHGSRFTTGVLGNLHFDSDSFDIWIFNADNIDVMETSGDNEWAAPPLYQQASAREFVPGGASGTVNRGTLFVRRGNPTLEAELLAFITKTA